jgi:hypothetical protein
MATVLVCAFTPTSMHQIRNKRNPKSECSSYQVKTTQQGHPTGGPAWVVGLVDGRLGWSGWLVVGLVDGRLGWSGWLVVGLVDGRLGWSGWLMAGLGGRVGWWSGWLVVGLGGFLVSVVAIALKDSTVQADNNHEPSLTTDHDLINTWSIAMERSSTTQPNSFSPAPNRYANKPGSARRRLRFYTRGIPVLLSVGAVMTLGASPVGEFLGAESAEAARTAANSTSSPIPDVCQVRGFAYVDENANGRFDDDENGLSGAMLSIRGRTNWFHAAADHSGRFSIAGLPAGPAVISIESPRAAERFGPARRSVNVGGRCVSLDSIALVPGQTEFASFG